MMDNNETFTIGQVAKKLNLNIETLYYYDRQGLLPFVKRDHHGNRQFTVDDLEMILVILHLKNAGVKLKDIKKFINWRMQGDQTLSQRYEFIQNQEKILDKEITNLQRAMQILQFKDWYYRTALDANTENIHLVPHTYRYNQTTINKFIDKVDNMSEAERELFNTENEFNNK